eukprot:4267984-Pleurochrysis_carterae.AAC.4
MESACLPPSAAPEQQLLGSILFALCTQTARARCGCSEPLCVQDRGKREKDIIRLGVLVESVACEVLSPFARSTSRHSTTIEPSPTRSRVLASLGGFACRMNAYADALRRTNARSGTEKFPNFCLAASSRMLSLTQRVLVLAGRRALR